MRLVMIITHPGCWECSGHEEVVPIEHDSPEAAYVEICDKRDRILRNLSEYLDECKAVQAKSNSWQAASYPAAPEREFYVGSNSYYADSLGEFEILTLDEWYTKHS